MIAESKHMNACYFRNNAKLSAREFIPIYTPIGI